MQKTKDAVLRIIRLVCSTGAVVFALLQLFGVWNQANRVAVPLLGVSLLIQTVQEWKSNRIAAVFCLCTALFLFGCTAVVLFL